MVWMNSYITIGDYEFKTCHSFQTKKSWKQLAQTATIKLHNIAGLLQAIKVGDPVLIQGAYDDEFVTEFTGYVSEILPTYPVEIKCEDEMWQRKQETFSGSWKSISLKNLLNEMLPGTTLEVPDVTLAPFRVQKSSKAQVLQKLKDEYLLSAYYRDKTLFVGLPYVEKGLPEVVIHFQKNAIPKGLVFKRKEDVKIKVRAVSVMSDNKRFEREYGDSDGQLTTLHFYNKSEAELKVLAEQQIERLKYDGYRGTFRTLGGRPFVDHSYSLNLEDDNYPERELIVFADEVVTDYGPNGYNRTITPGRKVVI